MTIPEVVTPQLHG